MSRRHHTPVIFDYINFVLNSDNAYPFFLNPYCAVKYEGGKFSKNVYACFDLGCIIRISCWSDKEVHFASWFFSMSFLRVLKTESAKNICATVLFGQID